MPFTIRFAGPEDAETLCQLIRDLAEYEHLLHEAHPDAGALSRHLAPDATPRCHALLAEEDGKPVGMALYFFNYSTFLTRWGLFLEDLFVAPEYRGKGAGFALLKRLAQIAVQEGCERLDWNVLDWNAMAISFYEKLGAKPQDDWTTMRLSGNALHTLGAAE